MLNGLWMALEAAGPIDFVRSSPIAYPIASGLHILGIGVFLGALLLYDLAIIRGGDRVALASRLGARRVAVGGFVLAAAAGLILFACRASLYVENPAFLMKAALLCLAGLNLLVTQGRRRPRLLQQAGAFVSIILWVGVVFAGRWIGFLSL